LGALLRGPACRSKPWRRGERGEKGLIKNRIPVAILYGGGYNRQPEFPAKLHRNTIATAKRLAAEYRGL